MCARRKSDYMKRDNFIRARSYPLREAHFSSALRETNVVNYINRRQIGFVTCVRIVFDYAGSTFN